MNKQQQDKQILANAPENWTHHAISSNKYFMIEGWRMHVWLGEVWSVQISNGLDVLMVGDVRSIDDIRELVQLRDEVAKYRKAEKTQEELNNYLGIGGA